MWHRREIWIVRLTQRCRRSCEVPNSCWFILFCASLALSFALTSCSARVKEESVFDADASSMIIHPEPLAHVIKGLSDGTLGKGIYRCSLDKPYPYKCEEVDRLTDSVVDGCWKMKKDDGLGCWLCTDVGITSTRLLRCWGRRTDGSLTIPDY
jgi:hypothetical protein